ncbi:synaptonemal complex protein 1 [Cyprinodon tularosa]|uniref:synaptonemal complex protein 1 n=1 Tax=Cyprinodon tularosa TaxID=77115 RepID=UPI0018E2082C|nr:synaptonemal complex protein 1 [Cyprinodon tularosa]
MDKERSFKFKLLVPPRISHSQTHSVRPQGIVQGHGNPISMVNLVSPSVNQSAPQNNPSTGELYTKLFDEVEKIKSWKVKVDTDTVEKERKLQDNKRTIENQRKAIQDLQFVNENLSTKLDEQISENEDLRNINNATRNLCNILRETCQRSSERTHLFETEREETHQLFLENSENIKGLLSAFETLCVRVKGDQQEMQKVKEDLLQFEDLKDKYHEELSMKDKMVKMHQKQLEDKENELLKALSNLNESQKCCEKLQDSKRQTSELLKSLKTEKESLLHNLDSAEQRCEDLKQKEEKAAAALVESKKEYEEIIRNKDLNIQDLTRGKIQQAEKIEKMETTIKELKDSLGLELQRVKDLEHKLMMESSELERNLKLLGETMDESAKKEDMIKMLKEELDMKSKSTGLLENKIDALEARVYGLGSELLRKTEESQRLMNEKEMVLAENCLLKDAYENVERAKEDLQRKAALAEVSEEKIVKLEKEVQKLEERNQHLRDEMSTITSRIQETFQEIENIQKETEGVCNNLQEQIAKKEKQIKAVEAKLLNLRKTFEMKLKLQEEFRNENKMLKKQIIKETAKSSHLEMMIKKLQSETEELETQIQKDYQKKIEDLESKSILTAELENEVQKLKLTSAEAVKNREEAELRCQHRISEMVALMEKHKRQYEHMVEEKDTELGKSKMKETEAVALAKSLELDLSKQRTENEQLKEQLKTKGSEMENLQKEMTEMNKAKRTANDMLFSQLQNKQSNASDSKQELGHNTPKKGSLETYDFSKTKKTSNRSPAVPRKAVSANKITKTTCETPARRKLVYNKHTISSVTKSYRVKTPPLNEKAGWWGTSIFEKDSKSDSSDHIDMVTCADDPAPTDFALQRKINMYKKIQSPIDVKTPVNSIKLAAMKRIRDAGWTAVTGSDKKKKTTNEKIFA